MDLNDFEIGEHVVIKSTEEEAVIIAIDKTAATIEMRVLKTGESWEVLRPDLIRKKTP